jgi:glycerophosphoryl diester phosphodiesterase
MALLSAHGGNRLHAPGNSHVALLSAYTCGADVLEFGVQLTADGQPVVAASEQTERMTGIPATIADKGLSELRKLDFGATFSVRGSNATPWKKDPPEARIETLGGLLDQLPAEVVKVIEAVVTGAASPQDLVARIVKTLRSREAVASTILCSERPAVLEAAASLAPELRTMLVVRTADAVGDAGTDANLVDRWLQAKPHGLVVQLRHILGGSAHPTQLAAELVRRQERGDLPLGVIVRQPDGDGTFSEEEVRALGAMALVYAISSASALDTSRLTRHYRTLQESSFAGKEEDPGRIHFGYAKANRYAHVYQADGVHLDIRPYEGPSQAPATDDPVRQRVNDLQEGLWAAARNWPFYSGGGFGTAFGIDGDFVAEVDNKSQVACQATTLEMAALNVDPAKHRPGWRAGAGGKSVPNVPESFRDKDSFFDPHGAPPFVGVEHDEDDGYRMNHNLGTEYDHNQYHRPLGDGRTLQGRFRLERRGAYFSAYYKDEQNPDWVCVGVCRNDSLNRRVFIRCAGKRWRQESGDASSGDPFFPIVANHIVFRNFLVLTPIGSHR